MAPLHFFLSSCIIIFLLFSLSVCFVFVLSFWIHSLVSHFSCALVAPTSTAGRDEMNHESENGEDSRKGTIIIIIIIVVIIIFPMLLLILLLLLSLLLL